MALTPDFDGFAQGHAAGKNQVVYTRLAADLDTPVSLMLKLTGAARDAFMLNYRTLMVSDANATSSDEAHNASLNALFNRFADVFTTDEVVALLDASSSTTAVE